MAVVGGPVARCLGVGAVLVFGAGCDPGELALPAMVVPSCSGESIVAPGGVMLSERDTLEVRLRVFEPGPVSLRVRVDAPNEGGSVRFPLDRPAAMSAAAAAVSHQGVYRVCVEENAVRMVLDAESAPHDRAWVRVTTARPVRARVETGSGTDDERLGPALTVLPGSSGKVGP